MKKMTMIMAVVIAAITMSCETVNEEVNLDEYYVKYEVVGSSIYTYSKLLQVTINDEDSKKTTFESGKRFDVIIGPVNKGHIASLDVNAIAETHNRLKLYLKISVSKNDGPFAYKGNNGSDQYRDSAQLSYIID